LNLIEQFCCVGLRSALIIAYNSVIVFSVQLAHFSSNTAVDGNYLLVSNLKDRVDKYTIPTLAHVQSFNHVILRNIPLQISVARQSGLLFVGGDNGFAQIFDYTTGAYRGQLNHGNRGDCITPVVVSDILLSD
jgi:hypothetical protein